MLTFERLKEILKEYKHDEWKENVIDIYTHHQFTISSYPDIVVVDVDYDEIYNEMVRLEITSINYIFCIYVEYEEDVFLQLLKIACPDFQIKKENKI